MRLRRDCREASSGTVPRATSAPPGPSDRENSAGPPVEAPSSRAILSSSCTTRTPGTARAAARASMRASSDGTPPLSVTSRPERAAPVPVNPRSSRTAVVRSWRSRSMPGALVQTHSSVSTARPARPSSQARGRDILFGEGWWDGTAARRQDAARWLKKQASLFRRDLVLGGVFPLFLGLGNGDSLHP